MDITVWGLIVIPVVLFLVTAAVAIVRGSIRFAQYLSRSESLQASTEKSNREISDKLERYMSRTDEAIGSIKQDVAVLKFALRGNHSKGNT